MEFSEVRRQTKPGLTVVGALLLAALILRAATLGDPNIHLDEAFYLQVGAAMHQGAVPYIDIWDRKPVGIFLIYWAIAALSTNPWCYQLIALLFATATAWVLARIARLWVDTGPALLAGISYLAMLNVLDGMGGQSPVFYNLLMALAAWLVLSNWHGADETQFRKAHLMAMALCGFSLTIKQTTLFEGVLFGMAGLFWLWRKKLGLAVVIGHCLIAIALAAVPTALTAAWYAGHGWWADWYHAMITSNLRRQGIGDPALRHNLVAITRLLGVYAGVALVGLVAQWRSALFTPYRSFMLIWLAVTIAALAAVPNFFSHYALPILLPMTLLAALGFGHERIGLVLLAMNLIVAVILGRAFDFKTHRASRIAFEQMADTIKQHRAGGSVLILYGPPLLYTATNSIPMSPLAFPEHLINDLETDVSPIRTKPEIERMLAARPSVVVLPKTYVLRPTDGRIELVDAYLAQNCRVVWQGKIWEPREVSRDELVYACRR